MRSSLSVDWVGLATSKRSPGVALLRPRCDFAGADRPGAHDVDRAEAGRLYGRAEIVHTSGATTARLVTSRNKRSAACGVAVGSRVNEQLGRECADNGAKID